MNTVVISECAPREKLLVHILAQRVPNLKLIRLRYNSSSAAAGLKPEPGASARFFCKRVRQYVSNRIIRWKFGELSLPETAVIAGEEINSEKCRALIQSLKPDLLFTCGAPILTSAIFSIPKIAALNFHFGIAPEYRGNDTAYWTLMQRRYELLGGTLHRIDRGVDTGQVIGRVFPELHPGDGELTVETRMAAMFAELGSEVVQWVEQGGELFSLKQKGRGANFRANQRTWQREISYLFQCATRRIRVPAREGWIERFFKNDPGDR